MIAVIRPRPLAVAAALAWCCVGGGVAAAGSAESPRRDADAQATPSTGGPTGAAGATGATGPSVATGATGVTSAPGGTGVASAASAAADGAAPARSGAASLGMDDALATLRQRLTERLSRGEPAETGHPHDLRVTPKAPGGATRAAARPAPVGRPGATVAATGTAPEAGGAGGAGGAGAALAAKGNAPKPSTRTPAASVPALAWDYAGPTGPAAWGGGCPQVWLCLQGGRQSPIDLRDGFAVDLEPVHFDYRASAFSVVDNGHTVRVNVAPGNAIEVGGRRYELQQFHFHRPSEEHIDGRQFEMSAHLVHRDGEGRLAVVAVLLDEGPAQPVVQTVWNNLPLEKHDEVAARITLDPAGLLPADRRYYTYMGSLTTPPCSEGVRWVVMRTPVTMASGQIELFGRLYPMNARPLQSAGGRRILQSE